MINTVIMKDKQNHQISMRLDKWLWCARFYKTRRLATDAIKAGKIKAQGSKVKPSHNIKIGEVFVIRRGPYTFEITVLGLANHRGAASEAMLLYQENEESLKKREQLAQQLKANNALMPHNSGRPTKLERRRIIRFTRKTSEE